MSLHTEWIRYGRDNQYSGYVARPSRVEANLPAVVVIQEIWGVDAHIQDVANRFAKAGYVALAPDLYATDGRRREGMEAERIAAVKAFLESVPPTAWHDAGDRDRALDQLPEPDRTNIRTTFGLLFGGVNNAAYGEQLAVTTAYLRDTYPASKGQPVVSVGYCMGGALSARLAASDPKLAGAAIFYGHAPGEEQIAKIHCPVRGYYGALDPRISDEVPGFAEKMRAAGKEFAYKIYDGAHHAFFNDTRASYNPTAARDAFAEVLSFFARVTG